jgi:hypothetical protein
MKKKPHITITSLVILIIAVLYYLVTTYSNNTGSTVNPGGATQVIPQSGSTARKPDGSYAWGKQSKTSGCRAANGLPDSACTPGDVLETDANKVCKQGYAGSVRNVPESEKNQVYAAYGITSHTAGQYEVDHLVSLELGGSNDISNLWPEAASPKPGFHEKDKVENYLHDQVCSGKMSLPDAQYQAATNWLAVYQTITK